MSAPVLPGTRTMPGPHITEDAVERALHWLVDHAPKIGKAKERKVITEHEVKAVEAELFKESDAKTVDAKWADVRADKRWRAAVRESGAAAGEYEKLLEYRRAAELRIEAWRTEQATWRANKL